jgi:hypothetical protein
MKHEELKSVLEVLKAAYVPADLDEQREKAITFCEQALAAQRQWVGLTDEERTEIRREHYARTLLLMDAVEAKLRSKNT